MRGQPNGQVWLVACDVAGSEAVLTASSKGVVLKTTMYEMTNMPYFKRIRRPQGYEKAAEKAGRRNNLSAWAGS